MGELTPAGTWDIDGDLDAIPIDETTDPIPESPPKPDVPPRRTDPVPPAPEKIAEAMLFAGGPPLTAEKFASAIRTTSDHLHRIVSELNKTYRNQNRPYLIQPRDGGYILSVRAMYRGMREKILGGPREARLTQAALDVLSVIAYRQPIDANEIDTIRGVDSATVLRQLMRLGLITVVQRGDSEHTHVRYGTTNRFLEIFSLSSLDDLPRLGESQQL